MMLRKIAISMMSLTVITAEREYSEPYRPQFHFSPPIGWTNDPNGLVYHNGYWELFYQYNPDSNGGGLFKHWGHARSTDLFHWENLPVAISVYNSSAGKEVSIFSGSAIADVNNVAGLTPPGANFTTLLAFYTAHEVANFYETQAMAYSRDNGITWERFEENPVIKNTDGLHDFRDPKVSKYNDKYIAMVASGDHIRFFESINLIQWELMSSYTNQFSGNDTVWECSDLFKLGEKWVLLVSHNSKVEYFVGDFDGRNFTSNGPRNETDRLYLDYGTNVYAGVTYEAAPDERRVFLAWLPGFRPYANMTPTSPWRGSMSIPRELSLVTLDNGRQVVASQPVKEISVLYDGPTIGFRATSLKANTTLPSWVVRSNLLDMNFTATGVPSNSRFGIRFAGLTDHIEVYCENDEYFIDRSHTESGFSADYELVMSAPRFKRSPDHKLRIVLDVSSVEVFIDGGVSVLTAQFFSRQELSSASVFFESREENASLATVSFAAHRLRSAWH